MLHYPPSRGVPVIAVIFTLFAATAATVSAAANRPDATLPLPPVSRTIASIASPSVCLDDFECGSSSYCKLATTNSFGGLCAPRLGLNETCRQTGECRKNTFCRVAVRNRCAPQGNQNAICNPVQGGACRPGLTCAPPTSASCEPTPACDGNIGRCRPLNPGKIDAPCRFDRNCDQNGGFYCRSEPGRCGRKFPAGERCNRAADNFECLGFCVTGFGPEGRGTCAPTQPLGSLCTDNRQCVQSFDLAPRQDRFTCNRPRGEEAPGRCARLSQLLKILGAPCNKKMDLCDARRNLSCRWSSRLRRNVCQQRHDRPPNKNCTPRSEFSSCRARRQAFPLECRVTRLVPGDPFASFRGPATSSAFCARRRSFVPEGKSCETESVFCRSGSVCRIVDGVRLREISGFSRFGTQPAVYCVRELKKGASCDVGDKFRTACKEGLRCFEGACRALPSPPPTVANTHAFIGGSCARLPCTPGFVCGKDKLCARMVAPVGPGKLCDPAKCKPGLVCRTRFGIYGLHRCRYPQGVGAYCQSDSWCSGKLRCPQIITQGREMKEQRCYDPSTALSIGDRCDPKKEIKGPRCSTVQVKDGPGFSARPLRCLPKKMGAFECQIDALPFGICNPANRLVCGDRRFECHKGVCLPHK